MIHLLTRRRSWPRCAGVTVAVCVSASLALVAPASAGTRESAATDRAGRAATTGDHAHRALERARKLRHRATHPSSAGFTAIDATSILLDLRAALPALSGADRLEADQLLARPGTADTGALGYGPGATLVTDCSFAHFCLHYSTTGVSATSTAQASLTGQQLEWVWANEVGRLGYRPPLSDVNVPNQTVDAAYPVSADPGRGSNPDRRFDVFLGDTGAQGYFGYCAPDTSAITSSAYCALDNDFAPTQFGGAAALTSLQATVAHEFFHAVQFAYNSWQDRWFMEGSAVWMEDEVYPDADDYLRYTRFSQVHTPGLPLDYQATPASPLSMRVYGDFLIFKFLSERFGSGIVREVWDQGVRYYSTSALRVVVQRRMPWPTAFALFAARNTEPETAYLDGRSYGAPALGRKLVLSRSHRSTGVLRTRLPHLTSTSLRVVPGGGATGRRLVVQVHGPSTLRGGAAQLVRHFRNGSVTYTPVTLGRRGAGSIRVPVAKSLAWATLVVSNGSIEMTRCGTDPSDTFACAGLPLGDHQSFTVRAQLR